MVLLIAAALGVPVLLSGIIFRNKSMLVFTTIVMVVVGAVTGSPVFLAADLLGIAAGYFVGAQFIQKKN